MLIRGMRTFFIRIFKSSSITAREKIPRERSRSKEVFMKREFRSSKIHNTYSGTDHSDFLRPRISEGMNSESAFLKKNLLSAYVVGYFVGRKRSDTSERNTAFRRFEWAKMGTMGTSRAFPIRSLRRLFRMFPRYERSTCVSRSKSFISFPTSNSQSEKTHRSKSVHSKNDFSKKSRVPMGTLRR